MTRDEVIATAARMGYPRLLHAILQNDVEQRARIETLETWIRRALSEKLPFSRSLLNALPEPLRPVEVKP